MTSTMRIYIILIYGIILTPFRKRFTKAGETICASGKRIEAKYVCSVYISLLVFSLTLNRNRNIIFAKALLQCQGETLLPESPPLIHSSIPLNAKYRFDAKSRNFPIASPERSPWHRDKHTHTTAHAIGIGIDWILRACACV